ncbi:MAG: porin family protein, partial [Phocaeicola sp.]|nr:porin family protein [Phocaeicola sp.]
KHQYIPRQTLPVNNSAALTTDQQHSVFQLPFGLATRYRFNDGVFQPYIGMKLGANYTKMSSDFYIYEATDNTWGLYVSPEIGMNIYPWTNGIGLHLAAFYNYSTNKGNVLNYDIDKLNNWGLRVGVAF